MTVFAGSDKYWKHQNDFYNDPDLRVKGVPCLMKWEGHNGQTSGMLVQRSLFDEPFLRYLFRNTDQPEVLFVADDIKNKQIVTVNGYDAYVDAMVKYEKGGESRPHVPHDGIGSVQEQQAAVVSVLSVLELPLSMRLLLRPQERADDSRRGHRLVLGVEETE